MNELKCPSCKNKTLINSEFKNTPVDICENCRGVWLDKGELNKVAHPIQGDIEFCSHEHTGQKSLSGLYCPRCEGEELLKAKFIEFSNISIDYCPKCDGMWLNDGELKAINKEIDSLADVPESWDHKIMTFISKLPF